MALSAILSQRANTSKKYNPTCAFFPRKTSYFQVYLRYRSLIYQPFFLVSYLKTLCSSRIIMRIIE